MSKLALWHFRIHRFSCTRRSFSNMTRTEKSLRTEKKFISQLKEKQQELESRRSAYQIIDWCWLIEHQRYTGHQVQNVCAVGQLSKCCTWDTTGVVCTSSVHSSLQACVRACLLVCMCVFVCMRVFVCLSVRVCVFRMLTCAFTFNQSLVKRTIGALVISIIVSWYVQHEKNTLAMNWLALVLQRWQVLMSWTRQATPCRCYCNTILM